jgi:4'-phosphopantetheinyl transferase
VRLYTVNIHAIAHKKARLMTALDAPRAAAASRQREDALRALASGLLLRYAARDLPVAYAATGKPFTEGGPHFNITHAGDYAALAVCETTPVGIDIENTADTRGGVFAALADRFFHPDEQLFFHAQPSPARFYEIWTRKEAYVKMTGEGFRRTPASFNVLAVTARQPEDAGGPVYTRLFRDLAPYLIAVCAREPVEIRRVTALDADSFLPLLKPPAL